MSEQARKLHAAIQELESELHAQPALDSDSREMLQEVLAEIQAALSGASETASGPRIPVHTTVQDRLKEAMRDFETTHPNLTGIVARLIDSLAQMGI